MSACHLILYDNMALGSTPPSLFSKTLVAKSTNWEKLHFLGYSHNNDFTLKHKLKDILSVLQKMLYLVLNLMLPYYVALSP